MAIWFEKDIRNYSQTTWMIFRNSMWELVILKFQCCLSLLFFIANFQQFLHHVAYHSQYRITSKRGVNALPYNSSSREPRCYWCIPIMRITRNEMTFKKRGHQWWFMKHHRRPLSKPYYQFWSLEHSLKRTTQLGMMKLKCLSINNGSTNHRRQNQKLKYTRIIKLKSSVKFNHSKLIVLDLRSEGHNEMMLAYNSVQCFMRIKQSQV